MNKIHLLLFVLLFAAGQPAAQAQRANRTVEKRLDTFFRNYETSLADIGKSRLQSTRINTKRRTLVIYTSKTFGYQPFTPENVKAIYRSVKQILPSSYKNYKITIYADGRPIEDLIPNALREHKDYDKRRVWNETRYTGAPWVSNLSRPYAVTQGLSGHHLALWQSHGRFFKLDSCRWEWQRPRLFCTTEDLLTQSFVVPFLIPMLENAGAVVFTPRERDWQRQEVIVDNDTNTPGSTYHETQQSKHPWQTGPAQGFARIREVYVDGQNPFAEGTVRIARTTDKQKEETVAQWLPDIPEGGRYAVYVSYQSFDQSVTDAHYIVYHKGGQTVFAVNQQMGGGTWVYLGTFDFDKGNHEYGRVILTNRSKEKGVVCADAVRFGGGMGNIARGHTAETAVVSGLPRYLEGARYQAQWSGMPYEVYSPSESTNDYADDINARSHMINYLSGGSIYNPDEKGLRIPFDLSIGLHSDAGISEEDGFIGSLGIYTTTFSDRKQYAGKVSRYASRDLADMVLSGLRRDISATFNLDWRRREMWNRNYSETRLPAVPSMILEMFSHQNFHDMKLGHDPRFKFTVARSVYKSLLKHEAAMHEREYSVQPLPVDHFAIGFTDDRNTVRLTWSPVHDPLEPTAQAHSYIVYTCIGEGGFDNGTPVEDNTFIKELEPGLIYRFKVTAVNSGGESFPSETLTAYQAKRESGRILMVNGFDRLSGPAIVETLNLQGFNLRQDPGVPYMNTPVFCGEQLCYDKKQAGIETEEGLGYSDSTWEGKLIAGNTFDYPYIHGQAFHQANPDYSFVSCSDEAIEAGLVSLTSYTIVDLMLGTDMRPFSSSMKQALTDYCHQGGNLIVSGSHLDKEPDRAFAEQVLKYTPVGNMLYSTSSEITGTGINFHIYRTANEQRYAVPSPACVQPVTPAFAAFAYTDGNFSAGIAYKGKDYRTFVLGFPLESITEPKNLSHILTGVLNFFHP